MSPEKFKGLKIGLTIVDSAVATACGLLGMRSRTRGEATSAAMSTKLGDNARPVVQHRGRLVQAGAALQKAGKNHDAIRVFEEAMALDGDATETAQILNFTANNFYCLGDYAQAQIKGIAALETARRCGATQEEGAAHFILGETALKVGELDVAADHFQGSADQFSQSGNLKATRQSLDRLVQILGNHPDLESEEFYRRLALEMRQTERERSTTGKHQRSGTEASES